MKNVVSWHCGEMWSMLFTPSRLKAAVANTEVREDFLNPGRCCSLPHLGQITHIYIFIGLERFFYFLLTVYVNLGGPEYF